MLSGLLASDEIFVMPLDPTSRHRHHVCSLQNPKARGCILGTEPRQQFPQDVSTETIDLFGFARKPSRVGTQSNRRVDVSFIETQPSHP